MERLTQIIDILKSKTWMVILLVFLVIIASAAAFVIPAIKQNVDKGRNIAENMNATEFNVYNGTKVRGSDVQSAIATYAKDPNVGVRISLGGAPSTGYYAKNELGASVCYTPGTTPGSQVSGTGTCGSSSSTISFLEATQMSGAKYVNPAWLFNANIYTDSAGNVVLIDFVKI